MRRILRDLALLAAAGLGLGNSSCSVSSNTSHEKDEEGDRETLVAMPVPGLAAPYRVVLPLPLRRPASRDDGRAR